MQDPKPIPVEQCTHHFFLSITSDVLKIAVDTQKKMRKLGYKSWIYTEVFDDALMDKIFNGIKKSVVFLAFITSNYLKSPYCMREIKLAGLLKKPIIPIVCEKFEVWPPEELFMQVMDTIYIPLFNNKNEWNDELFEHFYSRLPPADIIQVTFHDRSRSPSISMLCDDNNNDLLQMQRSISPPISAKINTLTPDFNVRRRSRSRSIGKEEDDIHHSSRKPLNRSPSTDVTLFHHIDNWPALGSKTTDVNENGDDF